MTISNSAPIKEQIAMLRRNRRACIGKIDRARATIQKLHWKVTTEKERYRMLGMEIEALGGKVRR